MEMHHFKYGLQTNAGGTTCLKGYINFNTNQDEDEVRAMFPGFIINPVNHLDVIEIGHFLSNQCYWTKTTWRQSEPAEHIINITVECHYHDVVQQQVDNGVAYAQ